MPSQAQLRVSDEPFSAARAAFDEMVEWLNGGDVPRQASDIERAVTQRSQELLRLLLQAHFDVLHARECVEFSRRRRDERTQVRARKREQETTFGRCRLWRLGFQQERGEAAHFPLDERLNLPRRLYSHALRERVVDEARTGAWGQAVERIDRSTGGHIAKRQAEQQAVEAAQDFERFYRQRRPAANDTLSERALLCMSSDAKGVAMRPEALRDATRKAAEAERAETLRGDPMAPKKLRRHDKRMAVVTAVWHQEPQRRSAKDIIENLNAASSSRARKRKKARRACAARPQNKRLSASVEKSQAEGITEMFDEAERRDPEHQRETVVLIDGEERQQEEIKRQAAQRGWKLTIVLDLIHVIHYLWLAANALCNKQPKDTQKLVTHLVTLLLTSSVCHVVAALRQMATRRRLSPEEREPVEKCAEYLTKNGWCLRYGEFLRRGFPIATGIIEGACRHLIQDRLGITGARWGLAGAEAILKLRAIHSSGDWDEYWQFHESCEAARNYPAAA